MQDTLIDQGINLMLFGMGTVFIFLTILVFATTLMSKVVNRLTPEQQAEPNAAPLSAVTTDNQSVNPKIVSAIEKAIAQHRQR